MSMNLKRLWKVFIYPDQRSANTYVIRSSIICSLEVQVYFDNIFSNFCLTKYIDLVIYLKVYEEKSF